MSAVPEPHEAELMTIDELAASVGMTVRTTRYYATLGLIPAPQRRGRVAWYDELHRARLEMVKALQAHGFTLQAIEGYLAGIPEDATVEQLALQRALLIPWTAHAPRELTRGQLEQQAGRALEDDEVDLLVRTGTVERVGDRYVALPTLRSAMELLDVDVPADSLSAASDAVSRHMDALAEELTTILRDQILLPFRSKPRSPDEAAALERTVSKLRQHTVEAVVAGFQRAANGVVSRSVVRD